MKNHCLVLAVTVLACTLASLAQADTVLYSAPVVKATGEGLTCALLNVSTQTRNLKVDVIEFFTNTILDSEQDSADPGGIVSASGDGLDGTYCRFTADGKKNDVRASVMVQTISTGATLSVITVP
jgi:hypothetical protein